LLAIEFSSQPNLRGLRGVQPPAASDG